MNDERFAFNRRRFFECLSAFGLGSTVMPETLTIAAQDAEIVTVEMMEVAQKIAGVSFTREEHQAITGVLNAPRGYMTGFDFLVGGFAGEKRPEFLRSSARSALLGAR